MKTQAWATTDVGLKRDHNEDSYLCSPVLELYAVADGMGGHLGGERASRLAVEILEREIEAKAELLRAESSPGPGEGRGRLPLPPGDPGPAGMAPEWDPHPVTDPLQKQPDTRPGGGVHPAALAMREAVRKAAIAIYSEAQGQPERSGMGTTLTAAFFHGNEVSICHVGDSRAYLFRKGGAQQLTEDHSWIQEQIRAGLIEPEDAMVSRFRNIITRSVGFEPSVEPDLFTLAVEPDDRLLLCSDGLSNYLNEEEMAEVLGGRPMDEVGPALVEMANDRGGDDNITCILVKVVGDSALETARTDPEKPPATPDPANAPS
jgi:serine/threonine protein phosphatase PrpC